MTGFKVIRVDSWDCSPCESYEENSSDVVTLLQEIQDLKSMVNELKKGTFQTSYHTAFIGYVQFRTYSSRLFLYTLEKTQGPKKTQGSRKNSGFCQFSSKLRSKTAIFGSLYLIRLQKNSGSSQKNSGFWMSCSSIDIHQGVQKKSLN